ncbi:MAG TPA: hypothetical protein VFE30_10875 [Anaeromyxobacteraceae bacterium]|jgi:hypothetical protein|nr:hypothetical protein [Anaeromyxobacteraceae bacterium]
MTLRPALTAVLLFTATSARAGLVIGTEDTRGGKKERDAVVYIEGNKLASDEAKDGKQFFIWDGDAHKMIVGDRERKTYQELTPSDVTGLKARASKAMDEAKARMTPEQRKAFEEMLAEQKGGAPAKRQPPRTEYVATSGGDRVLGHACKNYREVREGKAVAETCFIPWGDGVVSRADFAPLEKLDEFWRPMREETGAARGRGFTEELSRAPGVPAIRRSLGPDGKVEGEERLTRLERTRVPAERFAVPAGFTRSTKQLGEP